MDKKLGPDPNPSRKASFTEEEKFQPAEEPPQVINEKQLIVKTEQLQIPETNGSTCDFLKNINDTHFVIGTTAGQILLYDAHTNKYIKTLCNGGLSVY